MKLLVQPLLQLGQGLAVFRQDAQAHSVFNISAQIGDFISNFDDATFPGIGLIFVRTGNRLQRDDMFPRAQHRLPHFAAVIDNAVADSVGQHHVFHFPGWVQQRFHIVDDAEALSFVPKRLSQLGLADAAQYPFAQMAERRVAQVVAVGNGADELRIQPQIPADGTAYGRDVIDVLNARADMVVFRRKKHLGLVLEAAVGRRMKDARIIAAKFRAEISFPPIQAALTADGNLPVPMMLVHAYRSKGLFHRFTPFLKLQPDSRKLYSFRNSRIEAWACSTSMRSLSFSATSTPRRCLASFLISLYRPAGKSGTVVVTPRGKTASFSRV